MAKPRLTQLNLFLLLVLALSANTGCTTCKHDAFIESLQEVETVRVTAPARARVYTFLMNGSDLFELAGLSELRDQIVAAGFSKVYYAQRPDRHRDEPHAHFILVGYGSSADQIVKLARCATEDGIPLDAVYFLDPAGVNVPLDQELAVRTVTIRSHHWRLSPGFRTHESLEVAGVGHWNLPSHSVTVNAIVAQLTASALQVPVPQLPKECPPISDKPNPIPRPDVPMRLPAAPPQWQFLCPPGGNGISSCLQAVPASAEAK
jgi:hypothetical protein